MSTLWKNEHAWLVKDREYDAFPTHNIKFSREKAREFARALKQIHGGQWDVIPVTLLVQRRGK